MNSYDSKIQRMVIRCFFSRNYYRTVTWFLSKFSGKETNQKSRSRFLYGVSLGGPKKYNIPKSQLFGDDDNPSIPEKFCMDELSTAKSRGKFKR